MKLIFSSFLLGALFSAGLMATPTTAQVTFVNVGNPGVTDSNNIYVGPYTVAVNGANTPALCVDDKDISNLNSTWTAYVTQLSSGNLSNTYHPTSATEYAESAVLFNMITQTGADRIDIQHAAWDIMDYNINSQSALNSLVSNGTISKSDGAIAFIDDAMSDYSSLSLTGFEILTAASGPREQEFLVYNPSSAAPEPTTYALLGLGLLIIGGSRALFNKRKAAKQQPQLALVRRDQ